MSVMDEKVPGQPSQDDIFKMLLAKFGAPPPGSPSPGAGGDTLQTTAGVAPLAGGVTNQPAPPGRGMPTGTSGVPANNMPVGVGAPSSAQPPPRNSMSGGSYAYPNKSARNAAVVSTGIENISEAIHGFRVKKDQDEFQRAKSTMEIYQKAAAINPETGQPVDPHTMEIYRSDPKIVKGWEKYLKMEFPHEEGPPDPKTGKPTQGKPIIPAPQADPKAQVDQLKAQRELQQFRQTPGETGGLTPKEAHEAKLAEAGLVLSEKDKKAMAKIDAEIYDLNARREQALAEVDKLNAETKRLGPNDALRLAQIRAEKELANLRIAEATKALAEAKKSKGLQEFTSARKSIDDIRNVQVKALQKMQQTAMASRSRIGKAFGSDPDVSPEQDAQQDWVTDLNDAAAAITGYQDDVASGRMSATDALIKARRAHNLDSDFNRWGGVPSDAPQTPPKELPEGFYMYNPETGEPMAVKQGNKWVAP